MKTRFLLTVAALNLTAAAAIAQPIPDGQPMMQGQPMQQAPMQQGQMPQGDPNGTYCREYTQKVMIGGVQRKSYGTSCQQPDGSWKIMSSDIQQPPQGAQPDPSAPPVQYMAAPQYVSQPVYVQSPVYYQPPYPYYAYPAYPYYGGGIGIEFGVGHSWYHDGYHGGGYYRR